MIASASYEQDILLNVPDGGGRIEGRSDLRTQYVSNGAVVDRPTLNVPGSVSITVAEDWSLPDLPVGTELYIDGRLEGISDEDGLTLNFGFPAQVSVEFRPPFPTLPATCEVTVK